MNFSEATSYSSTAEADSTLASRLVLSLLFVPFILLFSEKLEV
jgi:hypothetical protein